MATTEDESISLTSEQQAVFDAAMKRHNIFLTGAAGCGKTVTIKKILAGFENRGIQYQAVAPTGLAAIPLSGKTLHSFFGWKPDSMQLPLEKLLELPSKSVRKAIKRTQVLIIEEVSMVENQHVERMNRVIQSVMEDSRPFGGKQVFLLGDFYQLPPVRPFQFCIMCGRFMSKPPAYRCQDCQAGNAHAIFYEGDKWAFKASVWKDLKLKNIRLKQLHRQKDPRFQDILNKIRNDQTLTEDEWQDLEREKNTPAGIGAVRLMSLRRQVDALNQRELRAITPPAKTWEAIDSYQELHGDWNGHWGAPWEMDQPLKNHSFAEKVSLKIGAKVVLLVNLDIKGKLVNGSQGEVIGFEEVHGVKPGPAESSPAIRPDGNKFTSNFEPIIRFANGRIKRIAPVKWGSRCGTNQRPYLASRTQIPLILAWALSIHKSQGMTLNSIEVSSKDLFEPGQLYVGLSRATSLEGLVLSRSSRKQLYTDPEVLSFYEETEWESSTTTGTADSLSNLFTECVD
jgi:ATP-dependent DNA helicase PIF1